MPRLRSAWTRRTTWPAPPPPRAAIVCVLVALAGALASPGAAAARDARSRAEPSRPSAPSAADASPSHSGGEPAPSAAEPGSAVRAVAPAAIETVVPAEPRDEPAAAAYRVLDRHCARCHQSGRLAGRALPEGGIAEILDLDAVARRADLVRPGEPDASPLFQVMAARQMPPELRRPSAPASEAKASPANDPGTARLIPAQNASGPIAAAFAGPDAADLAAVRRWIRTLPPAAGCGERAFLGRAEIMAEVARRLGAEAATGDLRFVSLASLVNRCASADQLAAARDGVSRLLNSLSWSKHVAPVEPVRGDLGLLTFRLSDLGWTSEHWELLVDRLPAGARWELDRAPHADPVAVASAGPAAQVADPVAPADPRAATPAGGDDGGGAATRVPVVPADWLAATAFDPALYARLLGLPATVDDLGGLLHVPLDDMRESRTMRRAVVSRSGETGAPRAIEHFAGRHGSFWLAHEFPLATEPLDLLDHPLQPWSVAAEPAAAAAAGAPAAEADQPEASIGTRALFTLPNGLPGFAAFDADGRLLTRSPGASPAAAAAETDGDGAPAAAVQPAGLACLACHSVGPHPFADELAAHLARPNYGGSALARTIATPTLLQDGEAARLVDDDRRALAASAYGSAHAPGKRLDGVDPVAALAARWQRDLDLAAAASDAGLAADALLAASRRLAGFEAIGSKLGFGRVTRSEFDRLGAALAGASGAPASSAPAVPGARAKLTLELWPTAPRYAKGDTVQVVARASAACHLTLVNVDRQGQATVLFPNEFDRDNRVHPGQEITIPGQDANYRFRLDGAGAETFVAICEAGEPVPAGMRPDFTRQNFTPLGDWEEFIAAAHAAARQPRVPLANGDDPDARLRRQRRGAAQAPRRPAPDGAPEQARAAIRIDAGG